VAADSLGVVNHEVLPGELSTFRAVGATGFGLGAVGGVALWLTQGEEIGSGGVAVLTTVLGVVIAAVASAAAVPLLDRSAESIVRWVYVAAGTATMALVLRSARRQVRDYASQVRKLALIDQLTGALNRRGFQLRASAELSRAGRSSR
jgi:uncharacterized membrane protein